VLIQLTAAAATQPPDELLSLAERGISAVAARDIAREWQRTLRQLETLGKPVAAVLNGSVLGGALDLALACHWRVMHNDAGTVLGFPEIQMGLLPWGGGTQRLPRLIGVKAALALLSKGKPINAAEASRLGIVNGVGTADETIDHARAWLATHAEGVQPWDRKGFRVPGGAGPLAEFANETFMIGAAQLRKQVNENQPAPLALMSCVYEGTIAGFDAGLAIESNYFGKLMSEPVTGVLMRATRNIARAKAGRRPVDPKASAPVKKIGVLGAGMMGAGIAHIAAAAQMRVVLLDVTQSAADAGKARIANSLAQQGRNVPIAPEQAAAVLDRIQPTDGYERLDGCDLIVEAVFEDRQLKSQVLQRAEARVSDAALVASNTSTLPISGLAQTVRRPANFIGLHFFSPVEKMPLLEIIRGRDTSQATLDRALALAAMLGKTPIVVNDAPGFFTTRVFSAFIDEGACMLAEGIEPALIENAAKQAGMPVGPLAQFDEVSQELSWRIIRQALADGLDARFTRQAAAGVIQKMMELNRRGRRAGGGFYEYPQGAKKFLWPALREHFATQARQPGVAELQSRLLTIQALEAARCVEEGVIEDVQDADVGSILGIGFPRWTGGVLSYIDFIRAQRFVERCSQFALRFGPRYQPSAWLRARAAAGESFHPRVQAS
jgi:3-hydroxyacyl-CoA dehydrogenase/enoyl-CoA hydratase/3-hydroxybutyryl-CoA epimerase